MAHNAPPDGTATQFKSGAKAAESGRKGGIASGEAKRKKKTMAQMAAMMMESPLTDKSRGAIKAMCKDMNADEMTVQSAMIAGQIKAAINGSTQAFNALNELADREIAKQEQQAAEEAARNAREYHTDLHDIVDNFHPLVRDIRTK